MFFMLTKGTMDSNWMKQLGQVLAPLGTLKLVEVNEAMKQIKAKNDVVIVDATFVENAEAAVSSLRTQMPDSRIVVMSAAPTWKLARAAFEAGAIDYLPKTMNEDDLQDAFRQILEKPLPPWPR